MVSAKEVCQQIENRDYIRSAEIQKWGRYRLPPAASYAVRQPCRTDKKRLVMDSENFLWRYTNLPSLIHILQSKSLTLLNPSKWDDSNDSYGMSQYKEIFKLKTLLALCFTETPETYHHWHVFGRDVSGVCIVFRKEKLLECFDVSTGFVCKPVQYLTLDEFKTKNIQAKDLPFVKRVGYEDECEFRVVYKNAQKNEQVKKVKITIDCIEKIRLSPWLPSNLKDSISNTIASIDGCEGLHKSVFKSTITGSNRWKDSVDAIVSGV